MSVKSIDEVGNFYISTPLLKNGAIFENLLRQPIHGVSVQSKVDEVGS